MSRPTIYIAIKLSLSIYQIQTSPLTYDKWSGRLIYKHPSSDCQRIIRNKASKALLIITHTVPYLSGSSDSDSSDVDLPGSILEISAEFNWSHPTGSSSSFLDYRQQNTTQNTCNTISSLTDDQDSSPDSLWKTYRLARITASMSHKILHFRHSNDNPDNYIANEIMGKTLIERK